MSATTTDSLRERGAALYRESAEISDQERAARARADRLLETYRAKFAEADRAQAAYEEALILEEANGKEPTS